MATMYRIALVELTCPGAQVVRSERPIKAAWMLAEVIANIDRSKTLQEALEAINSIIPELLKFGMQFLTVTL
ncbi:MAG: hypothetical protein ACJAYC_000211 [Halieaceae bacterium]|jgi:hypothetical protein